MNIKLARGFREKNMLLSSVVLAALILGSSLAIFSTEPNVAKAKGQPSQKAVLTILLRNSHSKSLGGAICEVLSYDWGLETGKPFSVIARGETNTSGVVAFDVTDWPRSGYRFRFSPTPRLSPSDTYIVPESENQYRGYPAAVIGGGTSETQRFFIASDGLAYNDQSASPNDPPTSKRDPVGGLAQPHVTIMASADFLATVKAGTATAIASGAPTPTFPPPPPSRAPGYVQSALTLTPSSGQATVTVGVSSTLPVETRIATVPAQAPTGVPQTSSAALVPTLAVDSNAERGKSAASGSPDLLSSLLLAGGGLLCLILFWRFRFQLYRILGIEVVSPERRPRQLSARKTAKDAPNPNSVPEKPNQTKEINGKDKQ
jgi:hypothetical protein